MRMESAEIEVDVTRLDGDAIDEHLRTSTAFLHEIMTQDNQDQDNSDVDVDSDESQDKVAKNTCTHCGKIYKQPKTLQRHIVLKHTDAVRSKCDRCDKTYPSQLSLEKHVRYMHREHRCSVCYKTFHDSRLLSEHGEGCRKVEMTCGVCGNVYASAVSLRNHMKYMHPARTGHWCEACRREFVSEANLLNHRNTVHPVGGTDCSCGRRFASLPRLQSHVLYKHTRDIAKCRHCHKVFPSLSRLARHLVRLHNVNADQIGERDVAKE